MAHEIVFKEKPENSDVLPIAAALKQFNDLNGPPTSQSGVVLQIVEDGNITGGLFGKIAYDWLFIDWLVVPEHLRGQRLGKTLMEKAEAIARERGCIGIHLDTLEFQARGFYEKLGYTVFGQLDDFPRGHARYFLKKRLS